MRRTKIAAIAVLALAVLLAGTGCRRVPIEKDPESRTTTETKVIELDGAKELAAEITQGVGELKVNGPSAATSQAPALKADFTYAPVGWKPEVTYSVEGTRGVLSVRQPEKSRVPDLRDAKNEWKLEFPGGVPTRLRLTLGVGKSDVDLRGVDVTWLQLLTGVGETTLDLTGPRPSDLSGRIEAGIGELTMRLPKDVGVRISGREDGVGSFSADGFIARGNGWENAAYATSTGPKIELDLQRGVGDVTLVLVP